LVGAPQTLIEYQGVGEHSTRQAANSFRVGLHQIYVRSNEEACATVRGSNTKVCASLPVGAHRLLDLANRLDYPSCVTEASDRSDADRDGTLGTQAAS